MFLPYLNYGLLLWGSCSESIFKLQKRVVRTISISKYNAHTNPIFKHLRLLKLQDLCTLSELKFCHRLEHNMLPIYFYNNIFIKNSETHNYLTWGTNNYQLPVFKHSFIKKSIRYRIPQTFNTTLNFLKDKILTHSFRQFSKITKNHFLESYSDICIIRNCFICQT